MSPQRFAMLLEGDRPYYSRGPWTIYCCTTPEEAERAGAGTSWSFAGDGDIGFDGNPIGNAHRYGSEVLKAGPIYIAHLNGKPYAAMSRQLQSWVDVKDRPVPPETAQILSRIMGD